jgi:hypothetical protein
MKNKGGRFVELLDYHSGSQQGHIQIPEGKKRGARIPLLRKSVSFSWTVD